MYNIALFGAGRIGLVHAANIAEHKESNLYSVIDICPMSATGLAQRYGAKVQTREEAMADPVVDAIVIAASTDTHGELITIAAQHGKPIFCEKPVHLDIARVRHCLAVVKAHNVPLLIGFQRRYDPQFRQIREMYRAGAIGQAESLLIISRDPCLPSLEFLQRSGGLFRDMTIHDFDMVRFIMGEEPVTIYAQGSALVEPGLATLNDIDTAFTVMKFASGAMAAISNSRRATYGYDQRLELNGQTGALRAKNIKENAVELWNDEGCQAARPEYSFLQRYYNAYKAEWSHFIDVLADRAVLECSGDDGERALYLAEKALASLQLGQVVTL